MEMTLQVLKLGASVTSFSLSPNQEILATTHPDNKGIYLWANSCIYSGAVDIVPSEKIIDARFPSITTGTSLVLISIFLPSCCFLTNSWWYITSIYNSDDLYVFSIIVSLYIQHTRGTSDSDTLLLSNLLYQ